MAAGGASSSKAGKVKVKCPARVLAGQSKVTCRLFGRLPAGPQGPRAQKAPKGPKGDKGQKGEKGDKGATGAPGISGYEVVNQTFEGVFIENSGGMRGLSEVKTVACPAGKRAIGGGTDLGTNAAQNGQQRQVTVSLSGPERHRHRLVGPALQQLDLSRHLNRPARLRNLRQRQLSS